MLREFHGGRMPRFRAGPDFRTTVSYSPVCTASPLPLHRDLVYEKKHMETQSHDISGVGFGRGGGAAKGLPLS